MARGGTPSICCRRRAADGYRCRLRFVFVPAKAQGADDNVAFRVQALHDTGRAGLFQETADTHSQHRDGSSRRRGTANLPRSGKVE